MSKHYTDDDVAKAARAILDDDMAKGRAADEWDCADQDWLTDNARAALDAVAPAIAARALREFADNNVAAQTAGRMAEDLHVRADEIEAGR